MGNAATQLAIDPGFLILNDSDANEQTQEEKVDWYLNVLKANERLYKPSVFQIFLLDLFSFLEVMELPWRCCEQKDCLEALIPNLYC